MEQQRIEKLKQFLSIMNESLTKEDFTKSFDVVIRLIKDLKQSNDTEFNLIHENVKQLSKKLAEDNEMDTAEAKRQMNQAVCDYCDKMDSMHAEAMQKMDAKLATIKDGENGQDADETRIVEAVLAQIPPVKEQIVETPETIRDKLEILKEDDRLDKSAIKGLQEEIENLKLMISNTRGGGGGFKKLRWIAETPTGTCNDVNTVFHLSTTPDPENLLIMLNGMGQRNGSTYEYTLLNKTITFNSAPPTGSQVFAWYSK